ncbi:MAG: AraC family transcriptional regulator [Lysobacter sp.]|nr:MAG: AraC family transcriptional regulator [Lysobacter sp.]
MSFWAVVYAIGAAQAMLLASTLWKRTANPHANRLLSVFLGLCGLDLIVRTLFYAAPDPRWMTALTFFTLLPALHCGFFYVYVRTLTSGRPLRWRDTIHAAFFLMAVVGTAAYLYFGEVTNAQLFASWQDQTRPPEQGVGQMLDWVLFAYAFACIAAAFRLLRRYRDRLRERRSDADRHSMRWIDAMAAGQIAIWIIALTQDTLRIPYVEYELIYGALTVWLCVLGYLGLRQSEVRAQPADAAPIEPEPAPAAVDDPRIPDVLGRLSHLMTEEALYREPALTIAQVAKRSGYPEYLVSVAINRRLGGNFWDYINRLRIDAACRALSDPGDDRTVLDIAYDCGFTSKSTFNTAFKRRTGSTPSAYRQSRTASTDAAAEPRMRPD